MEAGCGWLPSWLHRIDEHLELAGAAEAPDLTMSATDYFHRNCWISTECDDRFVADVIRWLGDDHIVYETDFPHPDSKFPHATDHFLAQDESLIPAATKRKVLWDNAIDLYRFPDGFLPAPRPDGRSATEADGRSATEADGRVAARA
jgi:predicted TIM-barrel fold metal-dependent hydrolase